MKKIAIIAILSFLLNGLSNAVPNITSNNPCDVQIQAWRGTVNGYTAYFESYSCAQSNGATNIQPAGYQLQCMVFQWL